MRRPDRFLAGAATLLAISSVGALTASAESPVPASTASASSCPRTLKFGGSLYLDTDSMVPLSEVGAQVGETDPNPAQCALPDRLKVYRHSGHNSSDEVVYYLAPGTAELFRSGGQTGFPGAGLVRWLVLALVVGILLFAAVPAILGHLRQPPVEVGRDHTNWTDDA